MHENLSLGETDDLLAQRSAIVQRAYSLYVAKYDRLGKAEWRTQLTTAHATLVPTAAQLGEERGARYSLSRFGRGLG